MNAQCSGMSLSLLCSIPMWEFIHFFVVHMPCACLMQVCTDKRLFNFLVHSRVYLPIVLLYDVTGYEKVVF